jgi:hypothetical protein
MAFREVPVYEIREVLRLWLGGAGYRSIARLARVDRNGELTRRRQATTNVRLTRQAKGAPPPRDARRQGRQLALSN